MEGSGRPYARWRRWGVAVGVAVLLIGAVVVVTGVWQTRYRVPSADLFGLAPPSPTVTSSPTPVPGADLAGPLNLLLVGIDTRVSQPGWQPHADAVLILHVPAGLNRAYLVSLPRDLIVEIPAYDPAGFGGGSFRLLNAMTYGSRIPGEALPDPEQGFALLAQTVSDYTGIERFDAGAVLTFAGFTALVDAVGGVEIRLDRRVVSEHREPDGTHRAPRAGGGGYLGPQRIYEPGVHRLLGWEALDLARQRQLPGGDYTRQMHQRRLIRALVTEIVSQDLATDPIRLDRVLRAVGDALIFDGRGYEIGDFGHALRRLRTETIVGVGLPGQSVNSGSGYQGERLDPVGEEFLAAIRDSRVAGFLADHPELLDDRPGPQPTPTS